jgi:DNA-binding transcriptional ArsR family regulator
MMINQTVSKTIEPAACVSKLKALADSTRLQVIEALMAGPKHVNQLMEILDVEQSLLSHHLRVLRDVGLVEAIRDGKAVSYQLADDVEGWTSGKTIHLGCCKLSF